VHFWTVFFFKSTKSINPTHFKIKSLKIFGNNKLKNLKKTGTKRKFDNIEGIRTSACSTLDFSHLAARPSVSSSYHFSLEKP
jgi:hypothetical protein